MYFPKRKLVKIIGFSIISTFLFPLEFLKASSKKIINQNLTNKQKEIMFNEGTEKPFSSDLLKENRKGFYHCANCGAKLFSSNAKFDSGTGWPSFSESLPGAFKTKIDYSFGIKELSTIVLVVVHIMAMFLMMVQKNKKRFCNNGLCLIFKPE